MCRLSPDPLALSLSEARGWVTSLFQSSGFLEVVPKVWGAETHAQIEGPGGNGWWARGSSSPQMSLQVGLAFSLLLLSPLPPVGFSVCEKTQREWECVPDPHGETGPQTRLAASIEEFPTGAKEKERLTFFNEQILVRMISLPNSGTQGPDVTQEEASHCTRMFSQQNSAGRQAGKCPMSHAAHYESTWLLGVTIC